jgi:archaellum component FlaC
LPEIKPISGEVSYSCNGNDKGDASLTVNYGDNKKVQTTLNVQHGENNVNVNAALKGDFELFKDLNVQFNAKQPSEEEIVSKTVVSVDGKQYSMDYESRASDKDPKFHVVIVRPEGTSKILADAIFVTPTKGKGSLVIENIESFDLTAKVDGDVTALESFYLNGEVDSPKLGVKQLVFDIKAKDAGAGKTGVEFKATTEGKHLISGTTDFTTKTDKDKTVIEGKSTVKLTEGKGDEVTFKLVRNLFERSRDGEIGFGGSLGVNVGQRNYASELKVTDKEFNAKYSGCEGKSKCTKVSMRSALQKPSMEAFSHTFDFVVDMRPIGASHEYGIKSDTNRDGFKFRHAFETYLKAGNKPEYSYTFFVDTKQLTAKLDIPTRQVALEGSYKYPEKSQFGVYDGTLAFYIDKTNRPQQKSEVSFSGELKQNKGVMTGKGDIYLAHPKIKKLRVGGEFSTNIDAMDTSSKLEFDIFNNPADMIVITTKLQNSDTSGYGFNVTGDVEINSKGLGINAKYHEHAGLSFEKRLITFGNELVLPVKDFKFGYDFVLDQDNSDFVVTAFAQPIVSSSAKYDFNKYDMETESKVQWPGSVPLVQKATVTGLTKGNFMLNKGQQFQVDSGYELGKDLYVVVKGSGKEIFNGKVLLDANHFMKSNYHIDEPQLKAFGTELKDQFKTDFNNAEKDVKDKFTRAKTFMNEKCDKMSKSIPDFTQLQNECKEEFNKFVEELKRDEAIKKLIDQFVMVIEELVKVFETFTSYVKQQYEVIDKAVRDFYNKAVQTFNEQILPEIEKLYESLKELATQIYEQTAKILTAAFERIAKAMKAFEEDFNKISKAINEATSTTYEAISQTLSEMVKEIKELWESFKKQLQELPGIGYLKEKYNEILGEFHPIETLKAILAEVFDTLGTMLPPKAEPLFKKISDYINKVKY